MCNESFFINAPNNTWWIDSGSSIYVVSTMQGFFNLRKLKGNETSIYYGNWMHLEVQDVGTFKLILKIGYVLDLKETFYIPLFSKNLAFVARLVSNNYDVLFENDTFSTFINKNFVDGGLINGLNKIDLDPPFEYNYLALACKVITT